MPAWWKRYPGVFLAMLLGWGGAGALAAGFLPSDFSHYSDLTLESGDPVAAGYSVFVIVDTASLVSAGLMKSDGSDLAVAWDSTGAGAWQEIDVHLRPEPNETLATSSATQVWFAVQEAGGIVSYPRANRYRLYYTNPAALPADRARNGKQVYLFFDDFLGTTLDSSVWYVHPSYRPAVTVSGGAVHQNGFLSPGNIWQGPQIRMTTETAANVPTFTVSYSTPFAGECRFRSTDIADAVRPVNFFQNFPPPGFPADHDETTTFVESNGALSIRIFNVVNGVGAATLAKNATVIQPNVWYDYKATVMQTSTTPGAEVALTSIYLDGVLLDDSSDVPHGGYDPNLTSGTVGIETNPSTTGDYDWLIYRRYTPSEPVGVGDPWVDLRVHEGAGGTEVSWTAPGGAQNYDVIRGSLDLVGESGSGVDLGPVTCIEDDSSDTTTAPNHLDTQLPADGKAFFYLLRSSTAQGPGLYGHSTIGRLRSPSSGDCF